MAAGSGLKEFWPSKDQHIDTPGLPGAGVISSGTDPNAEGNPGEAAIKDFWEPVNGYGQQALPEDQYSNTAESSNSVSSLPSLPNRFEPSADTVELPTLKDRMPGTIDKQ